jgi:RNA polymerase sigma factor (sigma-70 family)
MAKSTDNPILHLIRSLADDHPLRNVPDHELLQRFTSAHDHAAFTGLMRRHGSMVLDVCRTVARNDADAEDAFQATFLILSQKAKSIRNQASIGSWLYGVAYRTALNARNTSARRQELETRVRQSKSSESTDDLPWHVVQELIYTELNKLAERYRAPLVLCYLQGRSQDEAARHLGVSKATVKNRLERGRELLRVRLVRRGLGPASLVVVAAWPSAKATASVPHALASATVKSATALAAGETTVGLFSGQVTSLLENGLKAMMVTKLKMGIAAVVAIGVAVGGAGVAGYGTMGHSVQSIKAAALRNPTQPDKGAQEKKPRVDSFGDPLPIDAISRLGTERFKHGADVNGRIHNAVFSPDGKLIVSRIEPFRNPNLRLWETATGKQLPGPWSTLGKGIIATAFSPDSKTLAAAVLMQQNASVTTEILLFDIASAKPPRSLAKAPGLVEAMVFADGGKVLVTAGGETIYWWEVASGRQQRKWQPTEESKESQNGGKQTALFSNPVLSPDAKSIALQFAWVDSETRQPVANDDLTAVGFDLANGKKLWEVTAESKEKQAQFAFSRDGKHVAMKLGGDHVEVRDAVTGKRIAGPVDHEFLRNTSARGFALSSDGATLATGGMGAYVRIWKIDDPEPKNTQRIVCRLVFFADISNESLAFSPDDKMLLASVDFDLQLYDLATLKEALPWAGHRGNVTYVGFSADGKRLLSRAGPVDDKYGRELASWDTESWKQLQLTSTKGTTRWPNMGTTSIDQRLFVGGKGEDRFVIYDMMSGQAQTRLSVPPKQDVSARGFFSVNNKFFVLAGKNDKGNNVERLFDVASGKLLCELPAAAEQLGVISAKMVAFSSDDRLVALVAQNDGRIHILDTATGKLRSRLGINQSTEFLPYLVFSPDGKCLATRNKQGSAIQIWDVETGVQRLQLKIEPRRGPQLVEFDWSADGRLLAVTQDRNVRLWELASLGVRRELGSHAALVRAVAFSPDGKLLASGCDDSTIVIWDAGLSPGGALNKAIDRGQLQACWQALADEDANKAYKAMRELAAALKETVAWLKDKLKPAAAVDAKRVKDLVGQLDDEFKVRQKAIADLERMGEQIVPFLDKRLAANPPLETRLVIQALRTNMTSLNLHDDRLQAFRAIETLENISTPEARQLLQVLAEGAPFALITTNAEAALRRMGEAPLKRMQKR